VLIIKPHQRKIDIYLHGLTNFNNVVGLPFILGRIFPGFPWQYFRKEKFHKQHEQNYAILMKKNKNQEPTSNLKGQSKYHVTFYLI
jgi:hypothetical protein